MVDKSWQMAGGPGSLLYEAYDTLRRGLNRQIVKRLHRHAFTQPGIVIEAGSGPGFATQRFGEENNVTLSVAVDYDYEALHEGRKSRPDLPAVVADIYHLPFKTGSVRLIWNSSTIEHLPDQRQAVQEMARLLPSNAYIFVGVPYRNGPLFFQRWIPETGVGIWLGTVYRRADVESWLREAGCEPVDHWRYFFWFFMGVMGRKK
jgi:SAM-dependent methyltransferase